MFLSLHLRELNKLCNGLTDWITITMLFLQIVRLAYLDVAALSNKNVPITTVERNKRKKHALVLSTAIGKNFMLCHLNDLSLCISIFSTSS